MKKFIIISLLSLIAVFVSTSINRSLAFVINPFVYLNGGQIYNATTDSSGNIYTVDIGRGVSKVTPSGSVSLVGYFSSATDLHGLAVDSFGSLYTCDADGAVLKLTANGVASIFTATNGACTDIIFNPFDSFIYITDIDNNSISKIQNDGTLSFFAPTSSRPDALAVDNLGNIYVANSNSNNVTKIFPDGSAITLGETGSHPISIVVDSLGNVYTANLFDNNITKISPDGNSETLVDVDPNVVDITVDYLDNIFVISDNNVVTRITPNGDSNTIENVGNLLPVAIVTDLLGNVYVVCNDDTSYLTKITKPSISQVSYILQTSDNTPDLIFYSNSSGTINYGGQCDSGDTQAVSGNNTITFNSLPDGYYSDCTISVTDNFGISNTLNISGFTINTVGPIISPINIRSSNSNNSVAHTGDIVTLSFNSSHLFSNVSPNLFGSVGVYQGEIIIDQYNNSYVLNYGQDQVIKTTPDGISSVLGSTGESPMGITIDSDGNIYTANSIDNNVTKITPEGVSSILGNTGMIPQSIVLDSLGNVYTANYLSNNVTKITPEGVSSVLASTGQHPNKIVVDSDNNLYVSNTFSVTKITPEGVSSILTSIGGILDLVVDSDNNLYLASRTGNSVTKITPEGVSSVVGNTGVAPSSIALDSFGNIYTSNDDGSITKISLAGNSSVVGYYIGLNPGNTFMVLDSYNNIYVAVSGQSTITKLNNSIPQISIGSQSVTPVCSGTGPVTCTATLTIGPTEPVDGPLAFSVTAGSVGGTTGPITTTTDGSFVVVDRTVPVIIPTSNDSTPACVGIGCYNNPAILLSNTPAPLICSNAFSSYLKYKSSSNIVSEVTKWQSFLNEHMGESLPLTGIYSYDTFQAVKRFQTKYFKDILSPWKISKATGYVYKTTRLKANKILGCPEAEVLLENGERVK